MHELLPIAGGLLLGALLVRLPSGLRPAAVTVGAVVIGISATVASGEFRISWAFLLIDIPGVALAAACGYLLARRLRRARVEADAKRRRID